MSPKAFFVISLVVLSFSWSGGPVFGENGPRSVVERFQANLLSTMKEAGALGLKGRYDRLSPIISETFSLPFMLRRVAGPFWKNASRDQRLRLVTAFHRMSAGTLATLFDGYDGERFEMIGQRPGPRKGSLYIDTQLILPEGKPIRISYVAVKLRERWWLVDVVVEAGFSEIKLRRSEYRRALKEGGVENLTNVLSAKADELIGPC